MRTGLQPADVAARPGRPRDARQAWPTRSGRAQSARRQSGCSGRRYRRIARGMCSGRAGQASAADEKGRRQFVICLVDGLRVRAGERGRADMPPRAAFGSQTCVRLPLGLEGPALRPRESLRKMQTRRVGAAGDLVWQALLDVGAKRRAKYVLERLPWPQVVVTRKWNSVSTRYFVGTGFACPIRGVVRAHTYGLIWPRDGTDIVPTALAAC